MHTHTHMEKPYVTRIIILRETKLCYNVMVAYLSSSAPAVSSCLAALNSSLLLVHPYSLPHFSAIHQGTQRIHLLATKMAMKYKGYNVPV